jgi:hypothetical protein
MGLIERSERIWLTGTGGWTDDEKRATAERDGGGFVEGPFVHENTLRGAVDLLREASPPEGAPVGQRLRWATEKRELLDAVDGGQ